MVSPTTAVMLGQETVKFPVEGVGAEQGSFCASLALSKILKSPGDIVTFVAVILNVNCTSGMDWSRRNCPNGLTPKGTRVPSESTFAFATAAEALLLPDDKELTEDAALLG